MSGGVVVQTLPVTNLTTTSVRINGHIDEQISTITSLGFNVWKLDDGSGTWMLTNPPNNVWPVGCDPYFHLDKTGLTPGDTYTVMARASVSGGSAPNCTRVTFTLPFYVVAATTAATVATGTGTTADGGGSVAFEGTGSVTARGVCWNTGGNPTTTDSHTTDGSGAGAFTSALTGLTVGQTYYVRAYATHSVGGPVYGAQTTFVATGPPTVATATVSAIGATTATSGGNVTDNGGSAVTARGVCWSTSTLPTIADAHTTDGSGSGEYTSALTGLSSSTGYHCRAYATNARGTAYGGESDFTTLPQSIATTPVTAVNPVAGTCASGGTISGSGAITARGVCWGTSAAPTIAGSKTTDAATSPFTSAVTGLAADTTYHLRAYAAQSGGATIYGEEATFPSTVYLHGALGRATAWNKALTAAEILADSRAGMQYYGRSMSKGTVVLADVVENRRGAKVPALHVRAGWWIQNVAWQPDPTQPPPTLYITGHNLDLGAGRNALTIGRDWMEEAIGVSMAQVLATPTPVARAVTPPEYLANDEPPPPETTPSYAPEPYVPTPYTPEPYTPEPYTPEPAASDTSGPPAAATPYTYVNPGASEEGAAFVITGVRPATAEEQAGLPRAPVGYYWQNNGVGYAEDNPGNVTQQGYMLVPGMVGPNGVVTIEQTEQTSGVRPPI